LKSKAKQVMTAVRSQKRFGCSGLYLALLVSFGLVCVGLSAARAQSVGSPPAQARPAHHAATPQSHAQEPHAEQPHGPRAHVYLLRGLFNVFSLGMDTLAEELSKHGVQTSVHNYADWSALAEQAASRYKAGTENPIILIGHSLGADAVMDMAAALGRRDVPVALVIPFDGTKTLYAPANVARVVNLTQRNYAYARGGAGFHGSLANVDVSFDANIDHINIDKAARTHSRAISEVMAVVGHPSAPPKGPTEAKPASSEPAAEPTSSATMPAEEGAKPSPPPASAAPTIAAPEAAPAARPSPAPISPRSESAPPSGQDTSTGSVSVVPAPTPQPAPVAKPAKPAAHSIEN
jgi:hypothetical protein